jgi:hypothetical protein
MGAEQEIRVGQASGYIQLTIFADGVARVKPLIIFRGKENSSWAPRAREAKRYDSRVVVKFNPKAYANTAIILFWLEELLLPVLGSRPTLLVMDLLHSHKTRPPAPAGRTSVFVLHRFCADLKESHVFVATRLFPVSLFHHRTCSRSDAAATDTPP